LAEAQASAFSFVRGELGAKITVAVEPLIGESSNQSKKCGKGLEI
jgi:hypothetical protein